MALIHYAMTTRVVCFLESRSNTWPGTLGRIPRCQSWRRLGPIRKQRRLRGVWTRNEQQSICGRVLDAGSIATDRSSHTQMHVNLNQFRDDKYTTALAKRSQNGTKAQGRLCYVRDPSLVTERSVPDLAVANDQPQDRSVKIVKRELIHITTICEVGLPTLRLSAPGSLRDSCRRKPPPHS